jgi:RNA polymerase sigma factor (TIGR02999 family)
MIAAAARKAAGFYRESEERRKMPEDVTGLLLAWNKGDEVALEKLIPLVYEELRRLAGRNLRNERWDHTIQTTALVHEAYLRLVDQRHVQWQNRAHFFAVSAKIMRHILINYARDQRAEKRGGNNIKVPLDEAQLLGPERNIDLIALDDALTRLAENDARKAQLVELRFFSGLKIEEAALVMNISLATAKRDWVVAKAWLYREIKSGDMA